MGDLIKNGNAQKLDPWRALPVEPSERDTSRRKPGLSASERARLVEDKAAEEARSILARAEEQARIIRNTAYSEGRAAALEELEAERRELRGRIEALGSEVDARMAEFWNALEDQVLKLSVEIASKIVRREVQENDDFVIRTVKAGLQQLRDRREIKVRVNPDDYETARADKPELMEAFDDVRVLDFVADRRVDKGGCVIESAEGNLDARISTQLQAAEAALLEAKSESDDDSES